MKEGSNIYTRALLLKAGKDNELVVSLEGGREGRERMEGRGGRGGMTVIHILMAPQYLNNNHVT